MQTTPEIKRCPKCGTEKPTTEFHKNRSQKDGLACYCKPCASDVQRSLRSKNREIYSLRAREDYYKRTYDLTLDDLDSLWDSVGGRCEICGDEMHRYDGMTYRFAVDHNHHTGEVRGILCPPCNMGLGHLKDSPEVLKKALTYLNDRGHYGP